MIYILSLFLAAILALTVVYMLLQAFICMCDQWAALKKRFKLWTIRRGSPS
jgi:hypothetical protein